jgi:uncharacterized protein (TIGR02145 family)
MVKYFLFLVVCFFLISCSYKNVEWFDIQGFMEGSPQSLDKYSLVYYFNNQQIDDFYKARYSFFINLRNLRNDLEFGNKSDRIEIYRGNHCNTYIPNATGGGCINPLRGQVWVKVFLRHNETGDSVLLGEHFIDMDGYLSTLVQTEVYLGPNKEDYKPRKYFNFDWDRASSFYSPYTQDTIYYYSQKLYKNLSRYEYNIPYIEEGKELNFSIEGRTTKLKDEVGAPLLVYGNDFKDSRDGHIYKTVKIGNQVWMAENLRYLPQVDNKNSFEKSRYFVYGYDGKNDSIAKTTEAYKKYGVLYNDIAARNVCPSGWHLPDTTEWNTLLSAVGGVNVAGTKLKSKSGWTKNGNGTDDYGFNVLPGGYRNREGDFYAINDYAGFWSDGKQIPSFSLYYYYEDVFQDFMLRNVSGLSVRCIKDSE